MDPFKLLESFFNHHCQVCRPSARYPASCYVFPVPPGSAQSMAKIKGRTVTYREQVHQHIADNKYQTPTSYKSSQPINAPCIMSVGRPPRDICVGLLFVFLTTSKDQDLDNSAKGFLDAIKGSSGLITDDMVVKHLECFKRINSSGQDFTVPTGLVNPVTKSLKSFVAVRIGLI